ncbi:MAG: endolytic transglycosylase MltG [Clostridia bacterium]
MARKSMNRSKRRSAPDVSRYTEKSLHRDREYGFYWYAWLWKALRPVLVGLCALVIVAGVIASGWSFIDHAFFAAVDPADSTPIDFVIERGQSITSIGNALAEQDLVKNPSIFKYIVQFQGVGSNISFGSYPLSRDMTVSQIIDKLTEGSSSTERTITIIPGWTVSEIADYLKKQGALIDTDEFLKLANDIDHFSDISYALKNAKAQGTLTGRLYQLEGYLSPDTYRVYTNATAESLMQTLLTQTDKVIDAVFNTPIEIIDEAGNPVVDEENPSDAAEAEVQFVTTLNEDQTIVLASIIEKEAAKKSDYAKVSAVFHNRLEKGMRLESDATVAYPLGIKRMVLTADELSTVNGYNTYTREGLPIGPICNPSKAAIAAARNPNTDYVYDEYLYFCAGAPETGELVFAKTQAEQQANVSKYRPLWLQYDEQQAQKQARAAANAQ